MTLYRPITADNYSLFLSRFKVDLSRFFPRRMKSTFLQVVDLRRPDDIHSRSGVRLHYRMGDMRRPTPSHTLNAYCTVIVRVSYGYGYTRGSGRVWVEIFGAGPVRVR